MRFAKRGICALAVSILGGCANSEPPPVPIQPVTIKAGDFCDLVDKRRDLTWDVKDTRETINNIRRMGAKWDTRCGKANKPTS